MIIVPDSYTPMHDEEVEALTSSDEESIGKMAANLNYFGNLLPIGAVFITQINQPGVPVIDTTILQLMDGSEITYPGSPLRTIGLNVRFVPNYSGKYLRCAGSDTGNPTGGSDQFAMGHNHGGATQGAGGGAIVGEEGDERKSSHSHTHDMPADLGTVTVDHPEHIGYAAYMKIR